jgi:starch synthase (maltosyl-transferring)
MYRLAKAGFTQSYTYFSWRNAKWEIEQYFGRDLPQVRDFFRPNLWPNTPDILTEHLQTGGRPAFTARLILAATLGANYGIYGPAFELMEHEPLRPGSEEYLNSEKYEVRHWDVDRPDSLRDLIARVNEIRRANPALQSDRTLTFHRTDNDYVVAYSKASDGAGGNAILTMVNVDPFNTQIAWVDLDLAALGLAEDAEFQVHDLLTEARYRWRGPRQYVALNPHVIPAHIFRIRRRVRSEEDFEYFL